MIRPATALKIVLAQASLAMAGSLYYSNFGDPVADLVAGTLFSGPGLEPCHLCWWARILMYPIVAVAASGLWFRDHRASLRAAAVLAVPGVLLETYHYLLQKTDWIPTRAFCTLANPCAASQQVDYLGFVTIPLLCLAAFGVILAAALAGLRKK